MPSFILPCMYRTSTSLSPATCMCTFSGTKLGISRTRQRATRRRRVRIPYLSQASEGGPPPEGDDPHDKGMGEGEIDGGEVEDSDDVDASDLTLPNLRELFEGAGRPGCEQCDGEGEIECPVCAGKGFFSLSMMDTVSSAQCRMCRGQRNIPCPTCRDMVYKSVLWWDQIPSAEEDAEEKWRDGPDGPRIRWGDPPAGP